jgi:hypothetical protein
MKNLNTNNCSQDRVLVCRIIWSYVPRHLNRASTLLRFVIALFSSVRCSLCFSSVYSVFPLCVCLFPLFFLFFLCFLAWFLCFSSIFSVFSLSTLSKTDRSYLRIVLRSSCLRSFISLPTLLKNSNLTTLATMIMIVRFFYYPQQLVINIYPGVLFKSNINYNQ